MTPNDSGNRSHIVGLAQSAADLDLPDLSVGQTFSIEHRFDSESVDSFATLVGDFSPLHIDEAFAEETEFGGRVVHGMLLASLFSTLVGMKIPGRRALYIGQDLNFRRTVLVGETVVATARVIAVNTALGVIHLATTILKADQSVAVSGTGKVRVRSTLAAAVTSAPIQSHHLAGEKAFALVTGASRGIGAAIAKKLAADGFAVGVNYKSNEANARQVVDEITRKGGVAVPVCTDIRSDGAAESMVSTLAEQFGRLDLLVNNAAPAYEMKSALELSWSDVTEQLDGSVRAPLALSRAAFPYLRQSRGSIVNIISQVVENLPPPRMLSYVLGKFGLLGLTRSLAVEWAGEGVRVNGVSPSLIETELTGHFNERVFKLEANRTPLRRLATPDDVAAAVSYLAGSGASFLTGVVVPVTGGQVMK